MQLVELLLCTCMAFCRMSHSCTWHTCQQTSVCQPMHMQGRRQGPGAGAAGGVEGGPQRGHSAGGPPSLANGVLRTLLLLLPPSRAVGMSSPLANPFSVSPGTPRASTSSISSPRAGLGSRRTVFTGGHAMDCPARTGASSSTATHAACTCGGHWYASSGTEGGDVGASRFRAVAGASAKGKGGASTACGNRAPARAKPPGIDILLQAQVGTGLERIALPAFPCPSLPLLKVRRPAPCHAWTPAHPVTHSPPTCATACSFCLRHVSWRPSWAMCKPPLTALLEQPTPLASAAPPSLDQGTSQASLAMQPKPCSSCRHRAPRKVRARATARVHREWPQQPQDPQPSPAPLPLRLLQQPLALPASQVICRVSSRSTTITTNSSSSSSSHVPLQPSGSSTLCQQAPCLRTPSWWSAPSYASSPSQATEQQQLPLQRRRLGQGQRQRAQPVQAMQHQAAALVLGEPRGVVAAWARGGVPHGRGVRVARPQTAWAVPAARICCPRPSSRT